MKQYKNRKHHQGITDASGILPNRIRWSSIYFYSDTDRDLKAEKAVNINFANFAVLDL